MSVGGLLRCWCGRQRPEQCDASLCELGFELHNALRAQTAKSSDAVCALPLKEGLQGCAGTRHVSCAVRCGEFPNPLCNTPHPRKDLSDGSIMGYTGA